MSSCADGLTRRTTTASGLTFAEDESDASDRVDQSWVSLAIDFLAKPRHLHVDDVVERCRASRFAPDFARQHLPRDQMALMAQQIFEQLEFAGRQLEHPIATERAPGDNVELEIGRLQSEHLRRPSTSKQRADAGQELRERKRLHQIVVCPEVEAEHTVVDAVASGENQNRRVNAALPQRLQDFEATPAGQHEIEDDKIKDLRVGAKEP